MSPLYKVNDNEYLDFLEVLEKTAANKNLLYCVICFRDGTERKLVDLKVFNLFLSTICVPEFKGSAFRICNICNHNAKKAMRFCHIAYFASAMNEAAACYKFRRYRNILYKMIFSNENINDTVGVEEVQLLNKHYKEIRANGDLKKTKTLVIFNPSDASINNKRNENENKEESNKLIEIEVPREVHIKQEPCEDSRCSSSSTYTTEELFDNTTPDDSFNPLLNYRTVSNEKKVDNLKTVSRNEIKLYSDLLKVELLSSIKSLDSDFSDDKEPNKDLKIKQEIEIVENILDQDLEDNKDVNETEKGSAHADTKDNLYPALELPVETLNHFKKIAVNREDSNLVKPVEGGKTLKRKKKNTDVSLERCTRPCIEVPATSICETLSKSSKASKNSTKNIIYVDPRTDNVTLLQPKAIIKDHIRNLLTSEGVNVKNVKKLIDYQKFTETTPKVVKINSTKKKPLKFVKIAPKHKISSYQNPHPHSTNHVDLSRQDNLIKVYTDSNLPRLHKFNMCRTLKPVQNNKLLNVQRIKFKHPQSILQLNQQFSNVNNPDDNLHPFTPIISNVSGNTDTDQVVVTPIITNVSGNTDTDQVVVTPIITNVSGNTDTDQVVALETDGTTDWIIQGSEEYLQPEMVENVNKSSNTEIKTSELAKNTTPEIIPPSYSNDSVGGGETVDETDPVIIKVEKDEYESVASAQ